MPPLLLPPYAAGDDLFSGPAFIGSTVGITPMYEFPDSGIPIANREIPREQFAGGGSNEPAAGQLLVLATWYDATAGSGNVLFPLTRTFAAWSTGTAALVQTFSDNGEVGCQIHFRRASGDSEDDCFVDSSGNFRACAAQGARVGGNFYTGPESNLAASGDTAENLSDNDGIILEGDLNWAGRANCLEFVVSVKRGTSTELAGETAGDPTIGVTKIGECNVFNPTTLNGLIGAWGWKYSETFNDGIPAGDWNGAGFLSESGSLARRIRTDDT